MLNGSNVHNVSKPNQSEAPYVVVTTEVYQFIMYPSPPVWLSSSKIRPQNTHNKEEITDLLKNNITI